MRYFAVVLGSVVSSLAWAEAGIPFSLCDTNVSSCTCAAIACTCGQVCTGGGCQASTAKFAASTAIARMAVARRTALSMGAELALALTEALVPEAELRQPEAEPQQREAEPQHPTVG